ncbi:MAG: porin family protein [Xanthomonadaceae bacterium]|nr:porin family protein [Xanthomonadaceae bacterium]
MRTLGWERMKPRKLGFAPRGAACHLRAALISCLGLFGMTALTAPAFAAEPERQYNRVELTPFAGYVFGGEFEDPSDGTDRDLDDDSSWGMFVDIAAEHWRHYELFYANLDTIVEGATPFDMQVQYLQIGGTVSHPDARHVIPYFGMTVGAARFSPDEPGLDNETEFAFSVGGGLRFPITDRFGVRFDARAFITVLDSDGDLFCVSDATGGAFRIRAKSDTFLQYAASLGVTIGF